MSFPANKKKSGKDKRILIITFSVIFAILLLIIAGIIAFPYIYAGVKMSGFISSLENDIDYMVIADPLIYNGGIEPDSAEEILEDSGEIQKLRELMLSAADSAGYSGRKKYVQGVWDVSIRTVFTSGGSIIVYLTDDGLLLTEGNYGFLYIPDDDAKENLYGFTDKILSGK